MAAGEAGLRQKRNQVLLDRHWAGAGAAATVGRRKSLVQVEMHDIGAEIARPRDADQRVHVGAVHVELRALRVQDFRDARDLLFEDAERVGIGEHQRGDIFIDGAGQLVDIHHAERVGFDVLDRIAGHAGCGRVGAVRRIGNEQLLAWMPLRLKQRAD